MFIISQQMIDESNIKKLIPEGVYTCTIKAEETISKSSGNNMIKVSCETSKGTINEYIVQGAPSAASKFMHILRAVGINPQVGMKVGASTIDKCTAKIEIKHKPDKDGTMQARISKWFQAEASDIKPEVKKIDTNEIPF